LRSYLDLYFETAGENSNLPTLRELERDYIAFLLDFTAHNITEVSRIMAISRTAVYQKINRFNIGRTN
jgi:DNA-binding NtrC family response regulator